MQPIVLHVARLVVAERVHHRHYRSVHSADSYDHKATHAMFLVKSYFALLVLAGNLLPIDLRLVEVNAFEQP